MLKEVAFSLLVAGFAAPLASAQDQTIDVLYSENELNVEATQVRLPELLDAIAFEVGFELVWSTQLNEFAPQDVEESGDIATVLKRILTNIDYALEYELDANENSALSIAKVVILGTDGVMPNDTAAYVDEMLEDEPVPDVSEMLGNLARQSKKRAGARRLGAVKDEVESESGKQRLRRERNPTPSTTLDTPPPANIVYDEQVRRSLAITTQRAQENLQSLVDALEEAEAEIAFE